MGFKLKPVEEKFFEFLEQHSELVKESAEILSQSIENPELVAEFLDKIDVVEQKADDIVTKISVKLQKTFITPFDREDIFVLTQKLDDVADYIKSIIERMHLYNLGAASSRMQALSALLLKTTKHIQKAMSQLDNIKKTHQKIEDHCEAIKDLEVEGDRVYREEMAKLFRECTDPIELIKLKDIFNIFEEALDASEDVADLVKRVVIKYV